MPNALSAAEIIRRAEDEIETARAAARETVTNKSAQTNRLRAALRRATRLLKPLLNDKTRRGRETTEAERRQARKLIDEIEKVWR